MAVQQTKAAVKGADNKCRLEQAELVACGRAEGYVKTHYPKLWI